MKKNNVVEFPKKIGVTGYTPEMGDKTPLADIDANISVSGKWRLKTKLDLKGRGIKLYEEREDGIKVYYATDLAFEKLENQYSIRMEFLLD